VETGREPSARAATSEEQADGPAPAPAALLERERQRSERITGIVLAGGRSRRMGHDKALMELSGRPLVRWVLEALRSASDEQLVVARASWGTGLEGLGAPIVHDRFEARGPLTGLHAGLKAARSDLCLVVACDLPLVRPELLELLGRTIGTRHAAVPYVGEGPPPGPGDFGTAREAGLQPLLAAYRRRCIALLEKLLVKGSYPTSALVAMVPTAIVQPLEWRRVDPDGRSFLNINTPEDLVAAARLLNAAG